MAKWGEVRDEYVEIRDIKKLKLEQDMENDRIPKTSPHILRLATP